MIPCMECGKSFVFAKIVEVDATYEALIRKDFARRGLTDLEPEDFKHSAEWMRAAMEPLHVDETIVYLDGCYFPVDSVGVEFEGNFAFHQFERLPHALAREQPTHLRAVLGERKYWFERERPDRSDDA